ncbi:MULTISPECIES: transcriptional regulator [Lactococcus]|uniref:helix-turn-helix transcriptional regulator n=1 Tax=Lactococcus TaxID=1357 RepID=UPI0022E6F303|nr:MULTISPECIES: PAS domain-containing protein [Lactococcus]
MDFRLKKYLSFIDFLSHIFGNNTEVVLHEIGIYSEGYKSSIVYIKNSISGRSVGSPGTDFLMKIISSKKYRETDFLVNYTGKSMNGIFLNSSSFFIKDDEGELIGMICINTDKTNLKNLEKSLESTLDLIKPFIHQDPKKTDLKDETVNENLYLTIENLIDQEFVEVVGLPHDDNIKLTRNQKMIIMKQLYTKGFFDLKDSVSKIASYFKMAEVSIYKYLQEIKSLEEK